jgi:hypothetical protein
MPVGASNQRGRRSKQPRASRRIITVYFILTRCPDPSLWLVKLWLLRVANTPDKQAILRYLVEDAGADINHASSLWGSGKRGDFYSHTTYCYVRLLVSLHSRAGKEAFYTATKTGCTAPADALRVIVQLYGLW